MQNIKFIKSFLRLVVQYVQYVKDRKMPHKSRNRYQDRKCLLLLSAYLMRIPIAHFPKIAQGRLPDPALADWKWFQPNILTVPDLSPLLCQNLPYPFLNVMYSILSISPAHLQTTFS